jgi:hypothetical protein
MPDRLQPRARETALPVEDKQGFPTPDCFQLLLVHCTLRKFAKRFPQGSRQLLLFRRGGYHVYKKWGRTTYFALPSKLHIIRRDGFLRQVLQT